MPTTKQVLKFLKLNENAITMALGALVVLVVGGFLFNTLRNRASTPEVAPQITLEAAQTPQEGQIPQGVGGTYKVQKGDTLWSIAQKAYGSGYNWTDIAEANKLLKPGEIEEGQELNLPQVPAKANTLKNEVGSMENIVSPTPSSAAVAPSPIFTIASDSYTVVRGDHLWGIAVRAYGDGYQWVKIWRANKAVIANHPNLIYVGQSLVIPREAAK